MTINLRHDADEWERRLPLLADEIGRLEPDLVGLQEIEIPRRQAERLNDLVQARTGHPLYALHQELKPGLAALSGEGIGVMSRFPIEATTFADIDHGRLVLFTRLRTPAGDAIDLYNTHLHDTNEDDRLPQAERTTEFMARTEGCTVSLLTGDMNAVDTSPTIRHFESANLVDTYEAVHGPEATAKEGGTAGFAAMHGVDRIPTSRIDYVFARPLPPLDGRVTYLDSVVCFDQRDDAGIYPSDHFGVMTTLRVKF